MTQCNRCLYTTEIPCVTIGPSGQCNYCDIHDTLQKTSTMTDKWTKQLRNLKAQRGTYQCLIGISGGLDSSIMLTWAVEQGLRPYVLHVDNGWNNPTAEHNMEILCRTLGVKLHKVWVGGQEYNALCRSFLWASVPDADIPNDMAMAAIMMRTAHKHGIKYILNGHNFRTEGSSPISWSYMDAEYIQSVWMAHEGAGHKLKKFPLMGFWEQIYYALRGITQVRVMHYLNPDIDRWTARLMQMGWKSYGPKHAENLMTAFVSYYLLPQKFHIDKSLTYHSALIRSGKMVRTDYLHPELPAFSDKKLALVRFRLGLTEDELDLIMVAPHSSYRNFHTLHHTFRRWRWLLRIIMRLGLIPYTFYKKYTS